MSVHYVVLSIFIIFLSACTKEETTTTNKADIIRPAKIVQVLSSNDSAIRIYPGTVEASLKSDLAFRVSGQLNTLPAIPGKRFQVGDILATLDDADYKNASKDKQAKFDLAKSQHEKIVELQKSGYVSPANVDESKAKLEAAEAALSLANDNLKHTQLLAPFNGIIAHIAVENHQTVTPNQNILQLRGYDNIDIRFSIPESLLGKLKRVEDPSGLCASVKFNAYPSNTYNACFKEFESTPDSRTRTYSVVHTMPQVEEFPVLPGMAVSVTMDLTSILNTSNISGVVVPLEAVFEEAGKAYVWKVNNDMRVNKTVITIEKVGDGVVLIVDGLQEGDAVVAAGVSYLQENTQVKALTKERGL